jgi:hypothetical protein
MNKTKEKLEDELKPFIAKWESLTKKNWNDYNYDRYKNYEIKSFEDLKKKWFK